MAAARRCDICGDFYPMKMEKMDNYDSNYIEFGMLTPNGNTYSRAIYDACPRCMESIKSHINILKQRGE